MSCSVLRRSSRASASGVERGSGTPAMEARRSTASGNVTPSVIITKSKMLPFFCEEKSNQACFWSLTKNEGVFSLLKGESPFHSRPAFFSDTRRPTTSETGSRAFKSSRKSGENRMVIRGLLSRAYPISRRGRGRAESLVLSRLFTGRTSSFRGWTSSTYVCIYRPSRYGEAKKGIGLHNRHSETSNCANAWGPRLWGCIAMADDTKELLDGI